MTLDEYFDLHTSLLYNNSVKVAWMIVEAHHRKKYGIPKCASWESFRALRSRYYRMRREDLM